MKSFSMSCKKEFEIYKSTASSTSSSVGTNGKELSLLSLLLLHHFQPSKFTIHEQEKKKKRKRSRGYIFLIFILLCCCCCGERKIIKIYVQFSSCTSQTFSIDVRGLFMVLLLPSGYIISHSKCDLCPLSISF